MPDITKIKIGNERERSYKDFPANREFKKRAEDDNPGGGWPADLPKPSVGGYGYTEQGEQTVITWDGDTEGKVVYDDTFFKVSDLTPSKDSMSDAKIVFNGVEYDFNAVDIRGVNGYYDTNALVSVFLDDSVTPKGIYFAGGDENEFVSSLTYGTPDTIHKIDEKYLPEVDADPILENAKSTGGIGYTDEDEIVHKIDEKYLPSGGGAMVVDFVLDDSLSFVESASKTVDEVFTAMLTGVVVGVIKGPGGDDILMSVGCATANGEGNPAFACFYDTVNSSWVEQIGVVDGEWAYAVVK